MNFKNSMVSDWNLVKELINYQMKVNPAIPLSDVWSDSILFLNKKGFLKSVLYGSQGQQEMSTIWNSCFGTCESRVKITFFNTVKGLRNQKNKTKRTTGCFQCWNTVQKISFKVAVMLLCINSNASHCIKNIWMTIHVNTNLMETFITYFFLLLFSLSHPFSLIPFLLCRPYLVLPGWLQGLILFMRCICVDVQCVSYLSTHEMWCGSWHSGTAGMRGKNKLNCYLAMAKSAFFA